MTHTRIVGLAPSGRKAGGHRGECWGLPWDTMWPRYTSLFEMHDRELFERRGSEYVKQLKQIRDVPIYMHEVQYDIPASVAYPFQSVTSVCGDYFNSSIAYMLALAITRGMNIELFGVDNDAGDEWAMERPCNEYLIGLATGKGFDVLIHSDSSLLQPQLDIMYLDERQHYVGRYGRLKE